MSKSVQQSSGKHGGSTQQFTEIQDITEDVVILKGGNACLILEATASNFALLSKEEQDAKIYTYAAFLNSLTFQIQILIQNKKVDISSYLRSLEVERQKTQNQLLAEYIKMYGSFIQELVKVNTVLDKKFYIVVSYSYLEQGAKGALRHDDFVISAKGALHAKANAIKSQLDRLSLRSKILEKEEIIKLFYGIFNEDRLKNEIDKDLNTTIISASLKT